MRTHPPAADIAQSKTSGYITFRSRGSRPFRSGSAAGRWIASIRHSVQLKVLLWIRRFGPRARWCDWLYAMVHFHWRHNRFPRKGRAGVSDLLFFLKTTDEIDRLLRRLVTDKELVKDFISRRLGNAWAVPTLAVLTTREEAATFRYPARCAIKPTHLSGHVIIRRMGEPIDVQYITSWFQRDQYRMGRQRCYLGLRPKVIVEPLVFGCEDPVDFKFFCFRGEPRVIDVIGRRRSGMISACYSADWELLPFAMECSLDSRLLMRQPPNLSAMAAAARTISREFTFIRVDMYSDGRTALVGELTNCPGNAGTRFVPEHGEEEFSRLLFSHSQRGAASDPF